MNHIGFLILFMIFWCGMIHGLEQSKLSEGSEHNSQKRRNIVSDNVLFSDIIAQRADSTSLTKTERILNRIVRAVSEEVPDITCNATADCARFSVNYVCVKFSAITVGICLPKSINHAATPMINGMNIVFALILSTLVSFFVKA